MLEHPANDGGAPNSQPSSKTKEQIKYLLGLEKMRKALFTLTGQRTEKNIYAMREIVADKDFIIEMAKLVEKYAIKYNTMLSIAIPK